MYDYKNGTLHVSICYSSHNTIREAADPYKFFLQHDNNPKHTARVLRRTFLFTTLKWTDKWKVLDYQLDFF